MRRKPGVRKSIGHCHQTQHFALGPRRGIGVQHGLIRLRLPSGQFDFSHYQRFDLGTIHQNAAHLFRQLIGGRAVSFLNHKIAEIRSRIINTPAGDFILGIARAFSRLQDVMRCQSGSSGASTRATASVR